MNTLKALSKDHVFCVQSQNPKRPSPIYPKTKSFSWIDERYIDKQDRLIIINDR